MLRPLDRPTEDRTDWIASQLLQLLERTARQGSAERLPGLPGAKRAEEEILVTG